ncbi:hypothetical protein [uncultured Psychrobacter sp.]|uniref:hypothetical protein n=1 Tax=uncultured Psychrobacter sp. TaxID=259303 RepID=UPI00260AEE53|nr:hypothetical protein [uncultured Psychrobacter sp.]
MSEDDKDYGFLETHYYFTDDSHSMNAFVKNRCDKALLTIIEELNKQLGWSRSLEVEILPVSEGGLVEVLKFISTPEGYNLFNTFLVVLTLISSRKPPPPTETALDKENKELTNRKLKLEIQQIEKQLNQTEAESKEAANQSDLESARKTIEELEERIYEEAINNYKIRKNLSVLYENIIEYNKVKAIGYTSYDRDYAVIFPEKIVQRNNFKDFILDLNEYEEIDEDAKIRIFSPNLDKGRYKWRGLYEKEDKVIAFNMKDSAFKNDVQSGAITFKNGSTIRAVLTTKIKMDMTGAESSRTYAVENVLRYTHDKGYTDTIQGKEYRANKKDEKSQLSILFDD